MPSGEPTDDEVDRAFADLTANLNAEAGPRDYALAAEPEEEFVPPEAPDLRGGDPLTRLAWVSGVGGPLVAIVVLIFWPGAPSGLWIGALVVALFGWAVLVWRMPSTRAEDDGDDGAVV